VAALFPGEPVLKPTAITETFFASTRQLCSSQPARPNVHLFARARDLA
jgi:hypothetical protein